MYFQPYGDEQQLNLNWIINEIINLHKQLDPDYETPSFTQVYPYSNLNRLNLDWILSELKALKELAPEPAPPLDLQAIAEALVALPFDSNTSYQIYDFISRDGEIWRATQAIAAGSDWDETKWFKTKIGTDLAVLERWINAINNSLTAEIEARQSADMALENAIDAVYIDVIKPEDWELGRIFIEDNHVWDYYNDNERIRTKAGFYYTFPKGTKFGLTDNTNYRYSVGYRINSIYYGSGWLKQDFILPNDAEVVICASKDPQTTETSVDDILSKLIIETPPEYQINELKGSLNTKLLRFESVALSSGVSNGQIARVPSSGTNSALTENSFVIEATFSNPSAILSNITVTKYAGYFTLTGTTGSSAGTVDIKIGNP